MNGYRIIKKFKNLTPAEEKSMAVQLNSTEETLAIIRAYVEGEVTNLDRELSDIDKLYQDKGDSHLYVATLLSKRATFLKLRTLITEKVVVTLDDQSEEV